MFTNLRRSISFAFKDFSRNKGISVAAIFVLFITTLSVTGLFFVNGISNFLISSIQDKIDVTAYFKADTKEEDILNIRNDILRDSPDIKYIQYVSKEDALKDFMEKHKDSDVISRALFEVGDNPFSSSLNINTSGDTEQYEKISNILQSDKYSNIVEKVDFSQKKDTISKIFSITSGISRFGIVITIVLVLVAILVVYNNIKLVINNSKEEINTMKIIGASNWFIRAPFVIEGSIFGFISFMFCFLITAMAAYFLSSSIQTIMPGFNLFNYFLANILLIILIQIACSVGLGAAASYVVVKKYLKM